jgi:hypothetical protein
MLDERITQFVHEAVRIRAHEFDQELAMRLLSVDTEAALAGQPGGSGRAKGYSIELRQDLRNRAHYIFLEIQRALGQYPQPLNETVRNYLVGLHVTEVRSQCSELQRMLQERFRNAAAFGASPVDALCSQLNDECTHLREKYTLEIEVFWRTQEQRSNPVAGPAGVVIQGNVGVVQTGAFASATVTQNVGAEDRAAMLRALNLVAATFRDSQQLADEHRRQVLEVVDQAKAATRQERPNPSLLLGMFAVICETLQTLAASQPAMPALRAAALPFGIAI